MESEGRKKGWYWEKGKEEKCKKGYVEKRLVKGKRES